MDKEGLDVAILYPSRGLFVLAVDGLDPELAAAIAKAYNDWMHDFCQVALNRMYGAGVVAPHDVSSAVEETRRVVKELGFRSVLMRPNHVNGKMWSDPYYNPLWEECQKLDIPSRFPRSRPSFSAAARVIGIHPELRHVQHAFVSDGATCSPAPT